MSVQLLRFACLLLVACGCSREAPTAPPSTAPAASEVAAAPAPSPAACELLDAMDKRTPVPLLPMMANHQKQNMRDHLVAVQEIILALATEDFAAIEKAAGRIGYSEQMGQMCSHMGAGAPGFTEQALNFHRTADTITAAARQRDRVAVTRALGTTLQTCTGCHEAFRQNVVDEPTFHRLTSPSTLGLESHAGEQEHAQH
jgi:hypothetical protein